VTSLAQCPLLPHHSHRPNSKHTSSQPCHNLITAKIPVYQVVGRLYSCKCTTKIAWLGDVVVRASDLRSTGREFDCRLVHCRVAYVNSAFHPSEVGKSSTNLLAGVKAGAFTCVGWQVTLCDPTWQVTHRSSRTSFR